MLAIASVVVFVVALAIHAWSFVPESSLVVAPDRFVPVALVVQLAVVVLLGRMMRASARLFPAVPREPGEGPFARAHRSRATGRQVLRYIRDLCPRWARLVLIALAVHAAISFALPFLLFDGRSVEERQGRYVLRDGPKVVRELTAREYQQFNAFGLRAFSGIWLLAAFGSWVYVRVIEPRHRQLVAEAEADGT